VVDFDHEDEVKWNLQIISSITTVDLSDGTPVILIMHEREYKNIANHSSCQNIR
jgi:hypothetical protein